MSRWFAVNTRFMPRWFCGVVSLHRRIPEFNGVRRQCVNYRIGAFLGLLCVLSISCVSIYRTPYKFQNMSMPGMMAATLADDDAFTLKRMIDKGLPIDNYYGVGNSDHIISQHGSDISSRFRGTFPCRTLLLESLHLNSVNCVRLLLERNVDVSKVDEEGNNALMMAAYLSEEYVIDVVNSISSLASININATNNYNATALGIAVRKNNSLYVRWLLENGADYSALNGSDSGWRIRKPILFDAVNASQDIFEAFMGKPTANICYVDCDGNGILTWLNPNVSNYEYRFRCLLNRGAKFDGDIAGQNILIRNMAKLGDCNDRISMICSCGLNQKALRAALLYAKGKGYNKCADAIERSIAFPASVKHGGRRDASIQ